MAAPPGRARPGPAGLPRRVGGEDQSDPFARPRAQGRAAVLPRSARALAHHHDDRLGAAGRHHRLHDHRRGDQRRGLSGLRPADSRPRLAAASGGGPVVSIAPHIPASDPEGALAGFENGAAPIVSSDAGATGALSTAGPGAPGKLAGFDPSDPEGALAGFGAGCAAWIARATVSGMSKNFRSTKTFLC